MWAYEKKLQYPVKIKNPNPLYAKIIVSQLGGPDGELAAATRYLNQRYSMPHGEIIGILTDVGTEVRKKFRTKGRCFWEKAPPFSYCKTFMCGKSLFPHLKFLRIPKELFIKSSLGGGCGGAPHHMTFSVMISNPRTGSVILPFTMGSSSSSFSMRSQR